MAFAKTIKMKIRLCYIPLTKYRVIDTPSPDRNIQRDQDKTEGIVGTTWEPCQPIISPHVWNNIVMFTYFSENS